MDSRNYAFARTPGDGNISERPINYLGASRSELEASSYAGAADLRLIHAMDDGLPNTAGATRTCTSLAHPRQAFGAASNLLKEKYALRGLAS